MLTSLHFFPEYLPSPRPSPAPILFCSNINGLCDIHSDTISQEVRALPTVFSSAALCSCVISQAGLTAFYMAHTLFTSSVNCLYSGSLTCLSDNNSSEIKCQYRCLHMSKLAHSQIALHCPYHLNQLSLLPFSVCISVRVCQCVFAIQPLLSY